MSIRKPTTNPKIDGKPMSFVRVGSSVAGKYYDSRKIGTRERIRQSQEKALDDILLAHEKEGREFGFATFGGPILNEGDILRPYEAMLAGTLGKTEPSQLRQGKVWTR